MMIKGLSAVYRILSRTEAATEAPRLPIRAVVNSPLQLQTNHSDGNNPPVPAKPPSLSSFFSMGYGVPGWPSTQMPTPMQEALRNLDLFTGSDLGLAESRGFKTIEEAELALDQEIKLKEQRLAQIRGFYDAHAQAREAIYEFRGELEVQYNLHKNSLILVPGDTKESLEKRAKLMVGGE